MVSAAAYAAYTALKSLCYIAHIDQKIRSIQLRLNFLSCAVPSDQDVELSTSVQQNIYSELAKFYPFVE